MNDAPAFPSTNEVRVDQFMTGGHPGMTLRDYFIAHAPAEPQPWFEPAMQARPAIPIPDETLSPELYKQWDGLGDWLNPEDADADVIAFDSIFRAAREGAIKWEFERAKQRYIQWPAAWADAMLAARAGGEK